MKNVAVIAIITLGLLLSLSGCLSKAVFTSLVSAPDDVRNEFNYETMDFHNKHVISKQVIEGSYLGKTKIGKITYDHLQFAGVLKGENRYFELYLADKSSFPEKGCADGFIEETTTPVKSDKKVLLFYNFHPHYDKQQIESFLARYFAKDTGVKEYPFAIQGHVWIFLGTFTVSQAENANHIQDWNCDINVNRKQRNKFMPYIRPFYGVPATILCFPVDVLGTTATGVELLFAPKRPEALWYPNLIYSIFKSE